MHSEDRDDLVSKLTTVFDNRLNHVEQRIDNEVERIDALHDQNITVLSRLESSVSQIQRILASIVGEPGTNIDGRLGTMQQNIRDTETRLRDEIRQAEHNMTKLEVKIDHLASQFGNMWKILALGAITLLIDIGWRFVSYLLHHT